MNLTQEPPLKLCSADHQRQEWLAKKQSERIADITRSAIALSLFAVVGIKPLNSFAEWSYRLLQLPNLDPTGLESNFKELNLDKDFNRTLKDGDQVLSYVVTSPFGDRVHPVTGEKKPHTGVDINTPVGTSIYAIGRPRDWLDAGKMFDSEFIEVACSEDPYKGKAATLTSTLLQDYKFHFFHLKSCNAGGFASGAIIGETGNTGTSTAPHLHFAVELKGQMVDPPVGFLLWALQGKEPQKQQSKPIVEKLRNAIAGQESNHDSKAVNPHSNALGYGQVMPENIKEWSTQCLGKPLTEDEFIKSKDKQVAIIDCKLTEYLQETKSAVTEDEQIRKVASMWYSGDPKLFDNPRPQTYGAGSYPSIKDYTTTVLERFKKQ